MNGTSMGEDAIPSLLPEEFSANSSTILQDTTGTGTGTGTGTEPAQQANTPLPALNLSKENPIIANSTSVSGPLPGVYNVGIIDEEEPSGPLISVSRQVNTSKYYMEATGATGATESKYILKDFEITEAQRASIEEQISKLIEGFKAYKEAGVPNLMMDEAAQVLRKKLIGELMKAFEESQISTIQEVIDGLKQDRGTQDTSLKEKEGAKADADKAAKETAAAAVAAEGLRQRMKTALEALEKQKGVVVELEKAHKAAETAYTTVKGEWDSAVAGAAAADATLQAAMDLNANLVTDSEAYTTLQGQIDKLQAEAAAAQGASTTKSQEAIAARAAFVTAEQDFQSAKKARDGLEAEYKILKELMEDIKAAIKDAKDKFEALADKKEAKATKATALSTASTEKEAAIKLGEELTLDEEELKEINDALKLLEEGLKAAETNITTADTTLKTILSDLSGMRMEYIKMGGVQAEFDTAYAKIVPLSTTIEDLSGQLVTKRAELETAIKDYNTSVKTVSDALNSKTAAEKLKSDFFTESQKLLGFITAVNTARAEVARLDGIISAKTAERTTAAPFYDDVVQRIGALAEVRADFQAKYDAYDVVFKDYSAYSSATYRDAFNSFNGKIAELSNLYWKMNEMDISEADITARVALIDGEVRTIFDTVFDGAANNNIKGYINSTTTGPSNVTYAALTLDAINKDITAIENCLKDTRFNDTIKAKFFDYIDGAANFGLDLQTSIAAGATTAGVTVTAPTYPKVGTSGSTFQQIDTEFSTGNTYITKVAGSTATSHTWTVITGYSFYTAAAWGTAATAYINGVTLPQVFIDLPFVLDKLKKIKGLLDTKATLAASIATGGAVATERAARAKALTDKLTTLTKDPISTSLFSTYWTTAGVKILTDVSNFWNATAWAEINADLMGLKRNFEIAAGGELDRVEKVRVAIDALSPSSVKLLDALNFAYNNLGLYKTPVPAWAAKTGIDTFQAITDAGVRLETPAAGTDTLGDIALQANPSAALTVASSTTMPAQMATMTPGTVSLLQSYVAPIVKTLEATLPTPFDSFVDVSGSDGRRVLYELAMAEKGKMNPSAPNADVWDMANSTPSFFTTTGTTTTKTSLLQMNGRTVASDSGATASWTTMRAASRPFSGACFVTCRINNTASNPIVIAFTNNISASWSPAVAVTATSGCTNPYIKSTTATSLQVNGSGTDAIVTGTTAYTHAANNEVTMIYDGINIHYYVDGIWFNTQSASATSRTGNRAVIAFGNPSVVVTDIYCGDLPMLYENRLYLAAMSNKASQAAAGLPLTLDTATNVTRSATVSGRSVTLAGAGAWTTSRAVSLPMTNKCYMTFKLDAAAKGKDLIAGLVTNQTALQLDGSTNDNFTLYIGTNNNIHTRNTTGTNISYMTPRPDVTEITLIADGINLYYYVDGVILVKERLNVQTGLDASLTSNGSITIQDVYYGDFGMETPFEILQANCANEAARQAALTVGGTVADLWDTGTSMSRTTPALVTTAAGRSITFNGTTTLTGTTEFTSTRVISKNAYGNCFVQFKLPATLPATYKVTAAISDTQSATVLNTTFHTVASLHIETGKATIREAGSATTAGALSTNSLRIRDVKGGSVITIACLNGSNYFYVDGVCFHAAAGKAKGNRITLNSPTGSFTLSDIYIGEYPSLSADLRYENQLLRLATGGTADAANWASPGLSVGVTLSNENRTITSTGNTSYNTNAYKVVSSKVFNSPFFARCSISGLTATTSQSFGFGVASNISSTANYTTMNNNWMDINNTKVMIKLGTTIVVDNLFHNNKDTSFTIIYDGNRLYYYIDNRCVAIRNATNRFNNQIVVAPGNGGITINNISYGAITIPGRMEDTIWDAVVAEKTRQAAAATPAASDMWDTTLTRGFSTTVPLPQRAIGSTNITSGSWTNNRLVSKSTFLVNSFVTFKLDAAALWTTGTKQLMVGITSSQAADQLNASLNENIIMFIVNGNIRFYYNNTIVTTAAIGYTYTINGPRHQTQTSTTIPTSPESELTIVNSGTDIYFYLDGAMVYKQQVTNVGLLNRVVFSSLFTSLPVAKDIYFGELTALNAASPYTYAKRINDTLEMSRELVSNSYGGMINAFRAIDVQNDVLEELQDQYDEYFVANKNKVGVINTLAANIAALAGRVTTLQDTYIATYNASDAAIKNFLYGVYTEATAQTFSYSPRRNNYYFVISKSYYCNFATLPPVTLTYPKRNFLNISTMTATTSTSGITQKLTDLDNNINNFNTQASTMKQLYTDLKTQLRAAGLTTFPSTVARGTTFNLSTYNTTIQGLASQLAAISGSGLTWNATTKVLTLENTTSSTTPTNIHIASSGNVSITYYPIVNRLWSSKNACNEGTSKDSNGEPAATNLAGHILVSNTTGNTLFERFETLQTMYDNVNKLNNEINAYNDTVALIPKLKPLLNLLFKDPSLAILYARALNPAAATTAPTYTENLIYDNMIAGHAGTLNTLVDTTYNTPLTAQKASVTPRNTTYANAINTMNVYQAVMNIFIGLINTNLKSYLSKSRSFVPPALISNIPTIKPVPFTKLTFSTLEADLAAKKTAYDATLVAINAAINQATQDKVPAGTTVTTAETALTTFLSAFENTFLNTSGTVKSTNMTTTNSTKLPFGGKTVDEFYNDLVKSASGALSAYEGALTAQPSTLAAVQTKISAYDAIREDLIGKYQERVGLINTIISKYKYVLTLKVPDFGPYTLNLYSAGTEAGPQATGPQTGGASGALVWTVVQGESRPMIEPTPVATNVSSTMTQIQDISGAIIKYTANVNSSIGTLEGYETQARTQLGTAGEKKEEANTKVTNQGLVKSALVNKMEAKYKPSEQAVKDAVGTKTEAYETALASFNTADEAAKKAGDALTAAEAALATAITKKEVKLSTIQSTYASYASLAAAPLVVAGTEEGASGAAAATANTSTGTAAVTNTSTETANAANTSNTSKVININPIKNNSTNVVPVGEVGTSNTVNIKPINNSMNVKVGGANATTANTTTANATTANTTAPPPPATAAKYDDSLIHTTMPEDINTLKTSLETLSDSKEEIYKAAENAKTTAEKEDASSNTSYTTLSTELQTAQAKQAINLRDIVLKYGPTVAQSITGLTALPDDLLSQAASGPSADYIQHLTLASGPVDEATGPQTTFGAMLLSAVMEAIKAKQEAATLLETTTTQKEEADQTFQQATKDLGDAEASVTHQTETIAKDYPNTTYEAVEKAATDAIALASEKDQFLKTILLEISTIEREIARIDEELASLNIIKVDSETAKVTTEQNIATNTTAYETAIKLIQDTSQQLFEESGAAAVQAAFEASGAAAVQAAFEASGAAAVQAALEESRAIAEEESMARVAFEESGAKAVQAAFEESGARAVQAALEESRAIAEEAEYKALQERLAFEESGAAAVQAAFEASGAAVAAQAALEESGAIAARIAFEESGARAVQEAIAAFEASGAAAVAEAELAASGARALQEQIAFEESGARALQEQIALEESGARAVQEAIAAFEASGAAASGAAAQEAYQRALEESGAIAARIAFAESGALAIKEELEREAALAEALAAAAAQAASGAAASGAQAAYEKALQEAAAAEARIAAEASGAKAIQDELERATVAAATLAAQAALEASGAAIREQEILEKAKRNAESSSLSQRVDSLLEGAIGAMESGASGPSGAASGPSGPSGPLPTPEIKAVLQQMDALRDTQAAKQTELEKVRASILEMEIEEQDLQAQKTKSLAEIEAARAAAAYAAKVGLSAETIKELQLHVTKLEAELGLIEKKITQALVDINAIKAKETSLILELDNIKSSLTEYDTLLQSQMGNTEQLLTIKINTITTTITNLNTYIQQFDKELATLQKQRESVKTMMKTARGDELKRLTVFYDTLTEQIKEITAAKGEMQQYIDSLKAEQAELQLQLAPIAALKAKYSILQGEIQGAQVAADAAQAAAQEQKSAALLEAEKYAQDAARAAAEVITLRMKEIMARQEGAQKDAQQRLKTLEAQKTFAMQKAAKQAQSYKAALTNLREKSNAANKSANNFVKEFKGISSQLRGVLGKAAIVENVDAYGAPAYGAPAAAYGAPATELGAGEGLQTGGADYRRKRIEMLAKRLGIRKEATAAAAPAEEKKVNVDPLNLFADIDINNGAEAEPETESEANVNTNIVNDYEPRMEGGSRKKRGTRKRSGSRAAAAKPKAKAKKSRVRSRSKSKSRSGRKIYV